MRPRSQLATEPPEQPLAPCRAYPREQRRSPAAGAVPAPLLEDPQAFGGCHRPQLSTAHLTEKPTCGPSVPLAWRTRAGVPFALVLKSRGHVERCPGGEREAQRPASPRPSRLRGAATRGAPTSRPPPPHKGRRPAPLAPGFTRGGSTAGVRVCACGGSEGGGQRLAGCGTNLGPFPRPPAGRCEAWVPAGRGRQL